MLASRVCGAMVASLLCLSGARADDNPELRQKFKDWVYANFDAEPDLPVKLVAKGDVAIKAGADVRLYTDGDVLRTRKPMAVFSYAGELFTVQLSSAQARALGIYAGYVRMSDFPSSAQSKRLAKPIFEVSDLKIENADRVPGDKEIRGTFVAKQISNTPFGEIIVRVGNRPDKSTSRANKSYDKLPADGVFSFTVEPVNSADMEPYFGPMPVFIDLLVTGIEKTSSIASNTLMTMVDVQPDHDAFGRSAVAITKQLIGILESVKDRETAVKAVGDFTQVSLKNQALIEAMERLGPVPPEKEKAINEKYNAEAETFAKKLEAQMTRLEQTDYGKQFFEDLQKSIQAATKQ